MGSNQSDSRPRRSSGAPEGCACSPPGLAKHAIVGLLSLWLLLGGLPASAETTVAVLGLDGKGVPTEILTRLSNAIVQSLAHSRHYRSVPGKALDEVKLVFGCVTERPGCMTNVGRTLRADMLLWGSLRQQQNGYLLTLKLLDVVAGRLSRVERVPLNAAEVRSPTNRITKTVRRMLGDTDALIRVIVSVDDATVRLDGTIVGQPKGRVAVIDNVAPGLHQLTVSKEGYRDWSKEISLEGDAVITIDVDLRPSELDAAFSRSMPEDRQSRAGWEIAFWVTASLSVGAAVALIPNGLKVSDLEKDKQEEIERLVDPDSPLTDAERAQVQALGCDGEKTSNTEQLHETCSKGQTHAVVQNILIGASAALAALSVYFGYKAFFGRQESGASLDPHSTEKDRVSWRIDPLVSTDGARVNLQISF